MARTRADAPADTYSTERPDPLELIARFFVPGSYRMPVEGRSSGPRLTTADVAAAVGYMPSPVERQAAVVVSTRGNEKQIADWCQMIYGRAESVVRALRPAPLDLDKGADRWRLRLVLFDAAHDIVWPEYKQTLADRARVANMRKATYARVHHAAAGVLQETVDGGRRSFSRALWGGN